MGMLHLQHLDSELFFIFTRKLRLAMIKKMHPGRTQGINLPFCTSFDDQIIEHLH